MKLVLVFLSFLMGISAFAQTANEYYQPLKYRLIGPFRGGRSVASTGVVGDPLTYYMSTTGGGLWKTTDAGQHWTNISDGFFETGSMGAITVSESHPYILYAGMGEHAPRGVMTSYGDGVYKSVDEGKTWKKMGLEATQHIARIAIHPTNPDIVYVAAQGALHAPNKERGIYKSTDGGASWTQILYVNDSTGCSELSMDMNRPDILYAGMWQHQRTPWKVISGGAGSGIYKSIDGGKNWKKIEKGLPKEKGKTAISVSRANSEKVYALIEGNSQKDKGGLFVSHNAGESWSMVSGDNRLTQRAWYYTEVFADPQDEHTVYVLSAPALRSIDGGKSWERLSGTHGDYHDLWINPQNPKNMVVSNDGGAAITFNRGASWSTQANMPTAQIYRLNADNLWPYHLYGGQQDNSSIKIATLSPYSGEINQKDWQRSAGGESAFLAFDPDNPIHVMGGSYLGSMQTLNQETGARMPSIAAPIQFLGMAARDMKYLYNWNSPIIWSQHEPGTFYHGAQLVLRTRDLGQTWEEISPDLTRNIDEKQGKGGGPLTVEAVGAENYGTISYLKESPHTKGVIWSGSDDGQVYRTNDGGEKWVNVTPKDLGEALVNAIEVSPHDPNTIYIATTKYKFNDYTPALYKSTNNGKSWKLINDGIPYGSFTRVVREDPDKKDLLYAGTERGIYISWNGGETWEPLQLNLPVTPILDLKVHQGDLAVATSGRSIWILDDLNILQQKAQTGTKIYQPKDAVYGHWYGPLNSSNTSSFTGAAPLSGINPANGVVIYYELPSLAKDAHVSIDIKDQKGTLVRSFTSQKPKGYKRYAGGPPPPLTLSKNKGLNRLVWDMRHETMTGVTDVYIEGSYRGHRVAPGTYTVTLTVDGKKYVQEANVIENPTMEVARETFDAYHSIMLEMEQTMTHMHNRVNQLQSISSQLKRIQADLTEPTLKETCKRLIQSLKEWDETMVQRKSKAYDDVENFENKFSANYLYLINVTESQIPRVNASSVERKKELDAAWSKYEAQAAEWLEKDLKAFNQALWEAGLGAIRLDKGMFQAE
ncbi:MAG: glycosyl hydrolase [Bacteroidota bacterium]